MHDDGKANILVVDDSPECLDIIKNILGADYRVRLAINGEVALKLAQQCTPDLVLLDVMMPGLDGLEICYRLKAEPALIHVPVIFISAMGEVTDEEKGFAAGAVDYIAKPISPPLVKARVATHIGLHRQRRDLEKACAKAEEGTRIKSEFLAIMSHEIRNPMGAILGMIGLLNETQLDSEQRAYLQTVQYAGEALLAILNDVLDSSKIEAGKLAVENIPFDLHQTVDGVMALMTSRAGEKTIRLTRRIAPDVPVVVIGDPLRLRQILLNLVSNAIKFTPKGEVSIEVACAGEANHLCIRVVDTGIGIPSDILPSLFSDFTQMDASIARRYGGTGLGLSICKRLVELMGGRIEASSEMGSGSVFQFNVPLPVGAIVAEKDGPELPVESPLRILLAEDNSFNQKIAHSVLTMRGHDVTVVADGAAAVQAVTTGRYDVVLMDVRMPILNGLEATQAIRRLAAPQNRIPIIALTAGGYDDERERCINAGMNDFITKPFSRKGLVDALRRINP